MSAEDSTVDRLIGTITDDQISALVVSEDGSRGWGVTPLGDAMELSPTGKVVMRRIWIELPSRRPLFQDGEPPLSWAEGGGTP